MLPVIERPTILLLAGFLLSFLEASGVADPTQHTQNEQIAQTIVGGLLAAITVVSGLVHHYYSEKQRLANPQPPSDKKGLLLLFLLWLKNQIFTKKPETATVISPTQPVQ